MKIIQLSAENVKRIKCITIKPDGSIVEITGKNGAGKTSVLDSIMLALGGKSVQPSKPIRAGCDRAEITIDLGELKVTRTWTADDRSYLAVESADGMKFPSPQSVLDKLVGQLTFDPLSFSRMSPRDQVATLKQVVGLDFSDLDRKRQIAYENRTQVNRDLVSAEATLKTMPIVNAPDEEISVAELAKRHANAMEAMREHDSKQKHLVSVNRTIDSHENRIKQLLEEIDRVEASKEEVIEERKRLMKEISDFQDPDADEIQQKLETAEQTNRQVRQKKQRAQIADRAGELRAKSARLTSEIEGIDIEKSDLLQSAKMPIDGLGFTADGVTFDAIPFNQTSAAEQLRVSVAMGLALNPKLRVMLIRDGSLLDSDSMRLVGEMAEQHQAQVWVETVDSDRDCAVVIEDGMVAVETATK